MVTAEEEGSETGMVESTGQRRRGEDRAGEKRASKKGEEKGGGGGGREGDMLFEEESRSFQCPTPKVLKGQHSPEKATLGKASSTNCLGGC